MRAYNSRKQVTRYCGDKEIWFFGLYCSTVLMIKGGPGMDSLRGEIPRAQIPLRPRRAGGFGCVASGGGKR